MLSLLFNEILYRPLLNVLVLLYQYLPGHDLGIAIIVLTVMIRLILFPLSQKSIRSQKALSEMQPKIDEIRKKYKDDKEKQSKALMQFYKENKVNPLSGCLPLVIQLLVFTALYRVLQTGLQPEKIHLLYSASYAPTSINMTFLNLIDLSVRNVYLAISAGVLQFFQSKMLMPKKPKKSGDVSSVISQQMTYFIPILMVFITLSVPGGVALYWVATSIFSIVQQYFLIKKRSRDLQPPKKL